MFDKLKQVRISKRARRGAVLGLCLCAAAGLGKMCIRDRLLGALVHGHNVLRTHAGGLFHQNIHAVLQAVDGDLVMQIVRNRGDNGVHCAGGNHFLPILEERDVGIFFPAHFLLLGVNVAQGAQRAVRGALRLSLIHISPVPHRMVLHWYAKTACGALLSLSLIHISLPPFIQNIVNRGGLLNSLK